MQVPTADGNWRVVIIGAVPSVWTRRWPARGLYRQLQVHECYATGTPMNLSAAVLGGAGGTDCLVEPAVGVEALRHPEPGFLILVAKSYGRPNTLPLQAGYRQVDEFLACRSGATAAWPPESAVADYESLVR